MAALKRLPIFFERGNIRAFGLGGRLIQNWIGRVSQLFAAIRTGSRRTGEVVVGGSAGAMTGGWVLQLLGRGGKWRCGVVRESSRQGRRLVQRPGSGTRRSVSVQGGGG